MANTLENIAEEIRENAAAIMNKLQLERLLTTYGEICFTGSYALNLMTWGDIDIQLILREGVDPKKALISILSQIMERPEFIRSKIIHFQGDYQPKLPRGLYLGFRLNFPEYGGEWKFDLWSLAEDDLIRNRELMQTLKRALTPQKRKLILEIKHQLQQGQGRVPLMASHHLYQAILIKNITSKAHIFNFLTDHGISFSFSGHFSGQA